MWRNKPSDPAGENIRAAAVADSSGVPQKVKHKIIIQPNNSISRYTPKTNSNTCTRKLIVAPFTVARRKHLNIHQQMEEETKMPYSCNGISGHRKD